mmetsp:Transcript_6526/g.19352  ORF Transcript_6526/g.19352 Transcript_6526/m.19352 type:complete len:725 (+) Transcript_6526:194-2368(+)
MRKQLRTAAWTAIAFVVGMALPELMHRPHESIEASPAWGQGRGRRSPLSARVARAAARARRSPSPSLSDVNDTITPFKEAVKLTMDLLRETDATAIRAGPAVSAPAVPTASAVAVAAAHHTTAAPADDVATKPLLIAVLTDPLSLNTIGLAAYSTWGREASRYATLVFFVGSCQAETSNFPGTVVCLDTPDTYPPQRKVFLMWAHLWRHHLTEYRWFMKVDHDTYVNVNKIRSLVQTLSSDRWSGQCSFVGLPALGRQSEQKKLGLSGRPYCSGLGYTINTHCMRAVGPHFSECFGRTVSNHSDTEFGRCMMKYANAECVSVAGFSFKQIYYQQDQGMVYPMRLMSGGQMTLVFQREPKATHFAATLLHPLKRPEDFYRFHKQRSAGLRPVQPAISDKSEPSSYKMALADLRQSCVNNALRQKEVTGFALPECPPAPREESPMVPHQAYVLTRDTSVAHEAFLEIEEVLAEAGIRAVQLAIPGWLGPPDGGDARPSDPDIHQRGDREQPPRARPSAVDQTASRRAYYGAVRELLRNASLTGARRVMVLEEHVMLSCNFKEQLWQLLSSARCSGHMFTERRGGMLLLGGHETTPDGLGLVEADRSDAFAALGDTDAALCYNVHDAFSGSFAGIYHAATFNEILKWMAFATRRAVPPPFGRVYHHLSDLGYPVRAAFPNLALPQPVSSPLKGLAASGNITSAQVAVRLRWYEGKFCRRGGQAISQR